MGSHLPTMTAREIVAILERAGFALDRVGSHRIYVKDGRIVPVPYHPGDLPRGPLKGIIRLSGMIVDPFLSH
ncbi:MAG: type II toxin-antitoxin system HicA family toxin [Thermomicrobiales bacterium]